MNRSSFLKDALMAIAVSLVPKVLQPRLPVVDKVVEEPVTMILTLDEYGNKWVERMRIYGDFFIQRM